MRSCTRAMSRWVCLILLAAAMPAGSLAGEENAATNALTNSIGMKFALIPAGEFMMGNGHTPEEDGELFRQYDADATAGSLRQSEYPCHRVRITKPYYMAIHLVTVRQFRRFVDDSGYVTDAERGGRGAWAFEGHSWKERPECNWRQPGFAQTDDHPVVTISWNDAVAFCRWLTGKENADYRLPTEAEWEYATRADTSTRYCCGDDPEKLAEVANLADVAAKAQFPEIKSALRANDAHVFTSPVGSFRPNAFGLYDMLGNAWQWCGDLFDEHYYAASPADDPTGPVSGTLRVTRGGSWYLGPDSVRSAARYGGAPDARYGDQGFRVVRTF